MSEMSLFKRVATGGAALLAFGSAAGCAELSGANQHVSCVRAMSPTGLKCLLDTMILSSQEVRALAASDPTEVAKVTTEMDDADMLLLQRGLHTDVTDAHALDGAVHELDGLAKDRQVKVDETTGWPAQPEGTMRVLYLQDLPAGQ